ncbi:hypothetical protein M433DRAFT_316648, partial [Acidomyces richmondensis BFW]
MAAAGSIPDSRSTVAWGWGCRCLIAQPPPPPPPAQQDLDGGVDSVGFRWPVGLVEADTTRTSDECVRLAFAASVAVLRSEDDVSVLNAAPVQKRARYRAASEEPIRRFGMPEYWRARLQLSPFAPHTLADGQDRTAWRWWRRWRSKALDGLSRRGRLQAALLEATADRCWPPMRRRCAGQAVGRGVWGWG